MCASLEQHLQGRSPHEQLRVAGDAIKDMAEVCFQRAEYSLGQAFSLSDWWGFLNFGYLGLTISHQ
ncbi:hypothetical protein ACSYAD_22585 [Acaryochloris marina NIES-2412]|uniref:hypothetical protein n=1 Tax=Acaryochloris marina TaxID=155978 RepID=UPI0040580AB2